MSLYRVNKMTEKVFAVNLGVNNFMDIGRIDKEDINALATTGEPVLIVDNLEDAAELFGVEVDDVVMVKRRRNNN